MRMAFSILGVRRLDAAYNAVMNHRTPKVATASSRCRNVQRQDAVATFNGKIPSLLLPSPYRRGFTLLELMMVIGVLAVLLAILMTAPRTVREAAFKKRAKVEATALAQAAIRYKAEYGFWPGEMLYETPTTTRAHPSMPIPAGMIAVGPADFTSKITTSAGALGYLQLNSNEVYQAFSTVGFPNGTGYAINPLNPKAIPFLDLKNEADFNIVTFPDPWGQPYRLVMGLNPKSMFTFSVTLNNNPVYNVSVSNVSAFAFSLGPSTFQSTNYIYSAGVGP
jgi:prepilin-type N-terminal cleavage/methylation domain-containing protein